jgi:hypothetical protein
VVCRVRARQHAQADRGQADWRDQENHGDRRIQAQGAGAGCVRGLHDAAGIGSAYEQGISDVGQVCEGCEDHGGVRTGGLPR